jgi:hypothetical protein
MNDSPRSRRSKKTVFGTGKRFDKVGYEKDVGPSPLSYDTNEYMSIKKRALSRNIALSTSGTRSPNN